MGLFDGFDLSKLNLGNVDLSGLLSNDVVKKVSEKANTSEETTKSVLSSALPMIQGIISGDKTDDEVTRGIADETKAEPSLIQKILTAIIPFIMNLFGKKDEAEEKVEEVKEEVKEEKEGLLGNIKEGLGNLTSGLSGLFTGKKDE